ncbi:MAG: NACHT domain-containing NTPase [Candidatus Tectimicrobiota bacterium]
MDTVSHSGTMHVEGSMQAHSIVNGLQQIQQNFLVIFQQPWSPPPDLTRVRADYLQYLRDSHRYLDMQGVRQVQQVTQQLELSAVYVPLKARSGQSMSLQVAGRRLLLQADHSPEHLELDALAAPTTPVPVDVALHSQAAVVVLGDPGAGKSTLLKVLALALAEQPDGPLPILVPLNAYARHLQQHGACPLQQFLGVYYASRQQQLQPVGALFAQALQARQAVLLLDGLDEVQARRSHLVGLVQDFVREHLPLPGGPAPTVEGDAAPAPLRGNRLVVTSRLVGYDEAPLSGPAWRTYTLSDFSRDDIRQFVTQWTLALARTIQGDSEPARQAAAREGEALLHAILTRPSVERLASNPLLLTILAFIKHTGVALPEQRVKLYDLYLQTLIESWNLARSLDRYPVGEALSYEETARVLAPLALWLRQENPTAGLVTAAQLEHWLTDYYAGEEWQLPRGEARSRGRLFLDSVQRYTNLLLQRGEQQYGFLHLTLEEMLAAQGLAQAMHANQEAGLALFRRYLGDPAWHETLQLTIGYLGVIQRLPNSAGAVLRAMLAWEGAAEAAERGRAVVCAGEALLDLGASNSGRAVALEITQALLQTMQSTACHVRVRRAAGDLLGRLGWTPEAQAGDVLLAPVGQEPTGLDAFRRVPGQEVWMGKYPVTNRQFARFVEAGGYAQPACWSEDGWAWRTGTYDSQAPQEWQDWLSLRPVEQRERPFWWHDRQRNSPLFPVVGITWFEAEAYANWLTAQWQQTPPAEAPAELRENLRTQRWNVRLPTEVEWEAAMGGRGDYPWGAEFVATHLNCADGWMGQSSADREAWRQWLVSDTDERREAGTTAVSTYPQGVSSAGMWDGSGNVWEWLMSSFDSKEVQKGLRGGAWSLVASNARVSSRDRLHPGPWTGVVGLRLVVAPVFS